MQIGMPWPDGPPKYMLHPRSDVVDVSDEASVRALFENAGSVEVSMVYGPASATRAGAVVNSMLAGSDEVRAVPGSGARRCGPTLTPASVGSNRPLSLALQRANR